MFMAGHLSPRFNGIRSFATLLFVLNASCLSDGFIAHAPAAASKSSAPVPFPLLLTFTLMMMLKVHAYDGRHNFTVPFACALIFVLWKSFFVQVT